MIFHRLVVGPLQTNCYIIGDENSREVFVVDPGDEPRRILDFLSENRLRVRGIINTHGHPDHLGAVRALQDELGIPFCIHPDEMPLVLVVEEYSRQIGLDFSGPPDPVELIRDPGMFHTKAFPLDILHTPGHSPGGICLLVNDLLLSGDTLFAGSVGRTDLPGGDADTLMRSIRTKLLCLDDAVRVHPGHGPATTIGRERRSNPFLRFP